MLVKFNTKEAHVDERTLAKMEQKIQNRFNKYFDKEAEDSTEFMIKLVENKKAQFKVELTMPYAGYQLRAETTDNMGHLAALDKAMDTMDRLIVKCKTKLSRTKHQSIEPSLFAGEEDKEEPDVYEIVKVKNYEMKPMTIQEAILNMNLLGHSFYVFLDRDNNKVSTVYRRNDGRYGVIEPA